MNIAIRIVLFFTCIISLSACKPKTPEAVAEDFANAYHNLDFDAAKKVATEVSAKQLDQIEQMAKNMHSMDKNKASKVIITMGETKMDGDKAIVYYTPSDDPVPHKVNLIKEKGDWKVEWNKMDAFNEENKKNLPKGIQNEEEPTTVDSAQAPGIEIKIGE